MGGCGDIFQRGGRSEIEHHDGRAIEIISPDGGCYAVHADLFGVFVIIDDSGGRVSSRISGRVLYSCSMALATGISRRGTTDETMAPTMGIPSPIRPRRSKAYSSLVRAGLEESRQVLRKALRIKSPDVDVGVADIDGKDHGGCFLSNVR